ncbi:MAG TPA: hypothetical protein DCQ98_09295 [Planctomycetaceae bacterium]|nr:hypothetical protein [Planctomycetaceae bacterium]
MALTISVPTEPTNAIRKQIELNSPGSVAYQSSAAIDAIASSTRMPAAATSNRRRRSGKSHEDETSTYRQGRKTSSNRPASRHSPPNRRQAVAWPSSCSTFMTAIVTDSAIRLSSCRNDSIDGILAAISSPRITAPTATVSERTRTRKIVSGAKNNDATGSSGRSNGVGSGPGIRIERMPRPRTIHEATAVRRRCSIRRRP